MRALIGFLLDRLPYTGKLRNELQDMRSTLQKQVRDAGEFPAGHYYSSIPTREEVSEYLRSGNVRRRVDAAIDGLPGIRLNREWQFALLREFATFYGEVPFPEQSSDDFRYYYDQGYFCYADAIFLYSFLRQTQPKRIIEVGSGFSSAVMLDSVEHCFGRRPEITFIEPYPDRLKSILKPKDKDSTVILEKKVQEVPLETFSSLRSGDLLFIDSSHVVKCGSDVQFLMFEVLPRIPAGVFVHFHDMFYPFEYPPEWLLNGRYWNEDYFVRAFLSYNSEWDIVFFNSYVAVVFNEFLAENMPLCLKNTGGSLYIRRTASAECGVRSAEWGGHDGH